MTVGTLDQALERAFDAGPERIAIRSASRELTYRDFSKAVRGFAASIRDLGVGRGHRVAIALPNSLDAAISIYGVLKSGAVIVPLNPSIKEDKLATILTDCSASMLVCGPELAGTGSITSRVAGLTMVVTGPVVPHGFVAFENLIKPRDFSGAKPLEVDLAALIYTSGSTGQPKGVMMTHRNMSFAATSISQVLEMSSADRVLSVLPLSFDYGLYQLFLCVQVGATLLLEERVRYPGQLVSMMSELQVTVLPGVPTLFRLLLSLPGVSEHNWQSLRLLTNTGAALSTDTIRALQATFPNAVLYSMYGLTECKRVSYLPPAELGRRPESVGIPLPGTEVWIQDEEGNPLGPGETGELMVRGPHVMQGYWNDPVLTSERLLAGRWPWERTLATRDLFRSDDEGFLYFVGRQGDIIKSRGERVSPREIENVLHSAPGVLDAAVVGMPHELLGEAVYAHVSPLPGVELEAHRLAEFCRDHLEDHLVPFSFVIHDELPRMPNGKIDRRALVDGKAKQTTTPAPSNSPGATSIHQNQLGLLLKESRQLIGCRATDVPAGVNVADWLNISRFVEATGDDNPLYLDARYGSQSCWRTLVAPPAFVLGIQVPEATGALQERDYDAVDILCAVELWWNDHIRLGDRVGADLRVFEVNNGPAWRGRNTVEITSRVTYQSEGRRIAGGSGLIRIHPLRLGSELFVERAIHSYTPLEIERIEDGLAREPAPRGACPRFYSGVSVGDQLPQIVRGPFTWSELITWMIAEGRSWPAGNIRYRDLVGQPGKIRAHAATDWPVSDRKQAREDLLTCADVGFSAPCARPAFIVALVAQLITTWMGDDAVLVKLSTSLHLAVLYGDTLWLTGQVTGKFIQEISEQQYFAVTVEVRGVNQLGHQVTGATAVVFLPERGRPLQLPIVLEQP